MLEKYKRPVTRREAAKTVIGSYWQANRLLANPELVSGIVRALLQSPVRASTRGFEERPRNPSLGGLPQEWIDATPEKHREIQASLRTWSYALPDRATRFISFMKNMIELQGIPDEDLNTYANLVCTTAKCYLAKNKPEQAALAQKAKRLKQVLEASKNADAFPSILKDSMYGSFFSPIKNPLYSELIFGPTEEHSFHNELVRFRGNRVWVRGTPGSATYGCDSDYLNGPLTPWNRKNK